MTARIPVTRAELAEGLRALGMRPGGTVLVHASLSSLGYVVGGAVAVCEALRLAAGTSATLVMPGFSPQLVHPAAWRSERREDEDPDRLGAETPLFDRRSTPVAHTIGLVAECFRSLPGIVRSGHPHVSFLAQGPHARQVTAEHPLQWRLSDLGPLGRLWDLDAEVLMIGTSWSTCTALHLAEYRVHYPGRRYGRWPVPVGLRSDGRTRWAQVPELVVWEGDFDVLGESAGSARRVNSGTVGQARCRLVPLRDLVDLATRWLPEHRDLTRFTDPPGWVGLEPADGGLPGSNRMDDYQRAGT